MIHFGNGGQNENYWPFPKQLRARRLELTQE